MSFWGDVEKVLQLMSSKVTIIAVGTLGNGDVGSLLPLLFYFFTMVCSEPLVSVVGNTDLGVF